MNWIRFSNQKPTENKHYLILYEMNEWDRGYWVDEKGYWVDIFGYRIENPIWWLDVITPSSYKELKVLSDPSKGYYRPEENYNVHPDESL